MEKQCSHLDQKKIVSPLTHGCEECLSEGETWVSLRICLSCGHVGCCNSSKHKHASKHYLATGHPLIETLPPEEAFIWCFVDETRVV